MSQIFATRAHGFDAIRWPIISFGEDGNRHNLIRRSNPGDLIAIVGTQTLPTQPADQGRLLGLAEFGRSEIATQDVLEPGYFEETGNQWPYSLPILRAWYFPDRPYLTDIFNEQLPYGATPRAVRLNPKQTAAVLAIPRGNEIQPNHPIIQRARNLANALPRGPRPANWIAEVTHNADVEAYTYVLRFGRRDIWKIGYSQNTARRLNEVNQHVPVEALNEQWAIAYEHKWPTSDAAFEMEQRVLNRLRASHTFGERVNCSEAALQTAWSLSI